MKKTNRNNNRSSKTTASSRFGRNGKQLDPKTLATITGGWARQSDSGI